MLRSTYRVWRTAPVLLAVALAGCLASGSSHTRRSGNYVSEETFAQITPGSSTMGEVQAMLGDPTRREDTGGNEIWKYSYTETTDSSGAVFLIFGGSNSTEKDGTVFIEFRDGIVVKKWRA